MSGNVGNPYSVVQTMNKKDIYSKLVSLMERYACVRLVFVQTDKGILSWDEFNEENITHVQHLTQLKLRTRIDCAVTIKGFISS